MKKGLLAFLGGIFLSLNVAAGIEDYDLGAGNLALDGYDPVAYFPEGGGAPFQAEGEFQTTYEGVLYFFANQANLDLFNSNPEKYKPAYGNWCAFAMANGQAVSPDLTIFLIQDGRLLLFLPGTDVSWSRNVRSFTRRANRTWKRISGEDTVFL